MEYFSLLLEIGKLVRGAVNQLRYPCCFNNFVGELAKEEDSLITRRKDVKDRIAHAKKQTRSIAAEVHKWDQDADKHVDDVKKLLNEARTKQNCCFGHCPDWIFRYRSGKKLAKRKTELEKFIEEGRPYVLLERVATLPSGILDSRSEKYLSFGSRQKAYEELMKAVKDDEVGMIGLYGMGGCGKTTMAMEVQKKAEAEHLFDKVLFVPVSSTVEVRRIQDKIASSLQFTFPENEEMERAKRLYMRLSQENKILVILDDVWEKLDFGAIGIPSIEDHKGCKVLITTRSGDVCTSNGCQEKKIQLQILTDEEAWALFQKKAGISEGTSDTLKHLAKQISNECKGLPVAIAAVASTLKGKYEVTWKVALNRLKSSEPVDIEKGLQDPYKCLELSYDYLDEKAKSLFLLCSVFPEDYEIPIELLARCAIGLGVVGEVRSYDKARNEVIAAKNKLMSSCLLLDESDDEDEYCVKMHDLVRDVAHLIAKKENKLIKCEVENDVTLEQNSVRYLWCKKLPNDLDCSNLEFLCITTKVEVLDEIFTRMGKLRVLFLDYEGWNRLPALSTTSFKTLTNLRCLILSWWKLSDISFVRYMKKLESLSLNECSLPSFLDLEKDDAVTSEVVESLFSSLKILYLRNCPKLRSLLTQAITPNPVRYTIFQNLQKVSIIGCGELKYVFSANTVGGLPQLEWLRIEFCDKLEEIVEDIIVEDIIGSAANDELEMIEKNSSTPSAPLVNHSPGSFTLFKLTRLLLHECPKLGSLFPASTTKTLISLEELQIHNCPGLKHLLTCERDHNNEKNSVEDDHDLQSVISMFLNLKRLVIERCELLQHIFPVFPVGGQNNIEHNSFTLQHLKELKITRCAKLEVIFPVSVVRCLPELEHLAIRECKELKQIMEEDQNDRIQREVKPCFPKLNEVYVRQCNKLKHLFSASASNDLPYLEKLCIDEAAELEELIGFEQGASNNFQFQHLKTLEITKCAKLEVIFPVSVVRCLPQLEPLEIVGCKELKHIMEEDENDRIERELMPCFPKLTVVVVEQCHKLKRLFSASASDGLPNLEVLVINGANEIEQLIGCEQREDEEIGKAKVELPKLKLLILMHLPHLCQGIKLHVANHRIINNCPKLSLTSTTTLQDLYENFPYSDFANLGVPTWKLKDLINDIKESNEVSKRGGTSEIPSSQINEELEKESVGEFHGSEVHDTAATSTYSELNGRSSPIPLDIHQRETNIELEWDLMPENNSPLQMNQEDPTTSKSEQPSSQFNDNNQSILRNIAGTVHEHKQYESGALDFESNKVLALEREGKRIKTSSTGVEVISLGGIVKQDDKLNEGKTDSAVTRTRLEAYKQFVDLDDAQIALLEEAITAYPHLWNASQKFSERFRAWMLKTLADMLLFLQNESGHTVSPQREKEFHKLCDEAVELGFDRTWVDEMRQCVVERDPKLEENRAQESINELFKRSTGADMEPNFQVVEQGDGPNEHCIGTSQCQKMMQNVDNSIQEGFNLLIDKEGEIGVVSNDHIVAPIIEETKKFGLVDRQSNSEPSLMNQQKSLGEICLEETEDLSIQVGAKSEKIVTATLFSDSETRNSSPPSLLEVEPLQKNIKSVAEEGTISNNTDMAALSMHSESAIFQSGQLVTSQSKSYQHSPSKNVTTITQKSPIPPTSKSVPLAPITTKVAEPSKPVDKSKKKMVDQPKTSPKPVGEKLMSSAINSAQREVPAFSSTPPSSDSSDQKSASTTVRAIPAPKKVGELSRPTTQKELEIHQVLSNADGGDNQESLVKTSHDSTAEVTSLLKSPTIPVSATDVEIVEPSIDAEASKANLSMLEDIGESHPSEEVVEETAMKQDPKNDESETSSNPSAIPFVSPTPEEDREGPTYTTPDDADDEFKEDFKAFDIPTEWEQGLTPKASESTINKPDQRAECETFRTSFREKAFNVDILTTASDENLKVEVEEAAAKLLSFGGLVPEKERVRIQMFLDLLDEAVSKVKLQKNQQIQIDNIKNTSLDQMNQIEFAKQQANTSKLSFKENKSELVKLHASEKVLIEKIATLQLELSSVQIEKQTLESRQNDLRQTIKSSAAHAKSVAEQLKAQLEKKLLLETSQDELAESLKSLKKKQKTQGQNYFM